MTLEGSGSPDEEALFRASLARSGRIVTNCYLAPMMVDGVETITYHGPPEAYLPFAIPGYAAVVPDADNTLRRINLVEVEGGTTYYSFATQIVAAYLGESAEEVVRRVPAKALTQGALRIPYLGPGGTFPSISALDVLQGNIPPGLLEGGIAIVGSNMISSRAHLKTPFSAAIRNSGHELHANVVHGLLHGTLSHAPQPVRWAITVLAGVAGGLAGSSARSRVAGTVGGTLILTAIATAGFIGAGYWLPPLSACFALFAGCVAGSIWSRRRRP